MHTFRSKSTPARFNLAKSCPVFAVAGSTRRGTGKENGFSESLE